MVRITMRKISTKELPAVAGTLRAGERVLLSGPAYTARDAAHARLNTALDEAKDLPISLRGATIYYAGPTPTPPGHAIGSCGPTTSGRMDPYTPRFMDEGVCCTIGKGVRSSAVMEAIRRNRGVYLCALGGAGALASACITDCKVVAYEDLGCESIKEIMLQDFPLIVAIDAAGGSLFV